jgi:hypothetical protein
MNNKAQIPESVIILAALTICIAALYYTVTFPGKTVSAISTENVSGMFNEQKKFMVFAEEAVDLSAQQALADIAKSPSGMKCGKFGDLIIWVDGCPNNNEIKSAFIKKLNDSLIGRGIEIKSFDLIDGISLVLKEKSSEVKEKNNFIYYKINYTYSPRISASLDLDFEKIYSAAKSKKAECDLRFSTNTEADKDIKIGRCIEELRLDDWNVAVTSSGNYYSFTLNSKKLYFYDNSFKPIALKFALQK